MKTAEEWWNDWMTAPEWATGVSGCTECMQFHNLVLSIQADALASRDAERLEDAERVQGECAKIVCTLCASGMPLGDSDSYSGVHVDNGVDPWVYRPCDAHLIRKADLAKLLEGAG